MIALPDAHGLSAGLARQVAEDYERFADGLPADFADQIRDHYRIELASEYAGRPIASPFGKASGQLSLNIRQVERDAAAGLGFCVLKTVIAQDESGGQAMAAWAIHETHMQVEQIVGPRTGQEGWTVTWKGRGWWDTFEKYLSFFAESLAVGDRSGMVIAPSAKYHLPTPDETGFRESEYAYTTQQLHAVWAKDHDGPMPLEKDFSPTLAGSDRSTQQAQILEWVRQVPELVQRCGGLPVTLGVKIMNAMFDDAFQLEMVRVAIDESLVAPDFLIYANRLFDPDKEYEGKVGVAYGGPDLSSRNLAILEQLGQLPLQRACPPISATGDILTGKMAVAYGLRGATSFQMHTLFQLSDTLFGGTMANKTEKCLHHLYLHPEHGLIPWLLHLRDAHGAVDSDGVIRVADLPRYGVAV